MLKVFSMGLVVEFSPLPRRGPGVVLNSQKSNISVQVFRIIVSFIVVISSGFSISLRCEDSHAGSCRFFRLPISSRGGLREAARPV